MAENKLIIELNKNYVIVFTGYQSDNQLFVLNYIQEDFEFNENLLSEDKQILFNLINELIGKVENQLKLTFHSTILIIDDSLNKTINLQANNNISKGSFLNSKDYFNTKKIIKTKTQKEYSNYIVTCIDDNSFTFSDTTVFTYSYVKNTKSYTYNCTVYSYQKKYFDFIKELEVNIKRTIEKVVPSAVALRNFIINTYANIDNFIILNSDFSEQNLIIFKDKVSHKTKKLRTSPFQLFQQLNKKYKLTYNEFQMLINNYGYITGINFDFNLNKKITYFQFKNELETYFDDFFKEINTLSEEYDYTIFLFGEFFQLCNFEYILKKYKNFNCMLPHIDLIGCRNTLSYKLLGALSFYYRTEIKNKKNESSLDDDY